MNPHAYLDDSPAGLVERLCEAVSEQDMALAKSLLEAGADPNGHSVLKGGITPLFIAVRRNADFTKLLLEAGANPNAYSNKDSTPLDWAASGRSVEILGLLLDAGAQINHQKKDGTTPLMLAVVGNNADIVKCLLDRGADMGLKDNTGRDVFRHALANDALLGMLDTALMERDRAAQERITQARYERTLEAQRVLRNIAPRLKPGKGPLP